MTKKKLPYIQHNTQNKSMIKENEHAHARKQKMNMF